MPAAALRLLDLARAGAPDELGRARADLLRAQVVAGPWRRPLVHHRCCSMRPGRRIAPSRARPRGLPGCVLRGADRLLGLAPRGQLLKVARAVRAAPIPSPPPRACDLLLDGMAVLTTEGYGAGMPILKRALSAFRNEEGGTEEALRWLPFACCASRDVWDEESWYGLSARLIESARETGALIMLPAALLAGMTIQLLAGDFATATSMAQQADAAALATGNPVGPYGALLLAAWRGREAEACQLITAATTEMVARGEGRWLTTAHWATAVLNNGLGRYDEALAAAEQGSDYPGELGLATWSMAELIEAAARTGQTGRAADALRRLSETTRAAGTDWALGAEARSRALVSDGESAERLYREAIRPARPYPPACGASPGPAPLRRVAAAPEPPRGRARAAPGRD